MREVRTCILRLMIDTGASQALRGVLRVVANGEEHSFSDEQSLLALLRRVNHRIGNSTKECDDIDIPYGKGDSDA